MASESEIVQSLELIHKDAVVLIGENEYLPIGKICNDAAQHIKYLRERINELEAWRYGG